MGLPRWAWLSLSTAHALCVAVISPASTPPTLCSPTLPSRLWLIRSLITPAPFGVRATLPERFGSVAVCWLVGLPVP